MVNDKDGAAFALIQDIWKYWKKYGDRQMETKDWLDRQIEDAYQDLKRKSRAYIDTLKCRVVKDTIDWTKCEWVLCLQMPCEWRGEADELVSAANRYVTSYVLERWYEMVEPNRSTVYAQRKRDAMSHYRDTLHMSPVRTQYLIY